MSDKVITSIVASSATSSKLPVQNARKALKSRTGCAMCKVKRFKCDETKPACLQCRRRRLECPGYPTILLHWSTKYEKFCPQSPLPMKEAEPSVQGLSITNGTGSEIQDRNTIARVQYAVHTEQFQEWSSFGDGGNTVVPRSLSPQEVSSQRGITLSFPNSNYQLSRSDNQAIPSAEKSHRSTSGLSPSNPPWLLWENFETVRLRLSSVPKSLTHMPTLLVDRYFDSVCHIFSAFDNSLNPFRSAVEGLWSGWAPLYYTIQSMAAAYLSNDFPHMREVGLRLQSDAYSCLHQASLPAEGDLQADTKTLLTIIMLGLTTSWHDSSDLGIPHLQAATQLLQRRLSQPNDQLLHPRDHRHNQFFEQCILYWEMLIAMMSDEPLLVTERKADIDLHEPLCESHSQFLNSAVFKFPHPWTGIAPDIISLFARTGRLIRQTRKIYLSYSSFRQSMELAAIDSEVGSTVALEEACIEAQALEGELLAFSPPPADTLVDTGDIRTSLDHFVQTNECYRRTSLLLIYRNFPELLCKRLPLTEGPNELEAWRWLYHQSLLGILPQRSPGRTWISSLAVQILKDLEKIPTSSGTRFHQKILILAAAGELQFSAADPAISQTPGSYFCAEFGHMDSDQVDIASARQFVMLRLHELQVALPTMPVERIRRIVKETWKRLDAGLDDFWMDVMMEKQWETIAG